MINLAVHPTHISLQPRSISWNWNGYAWTNLYTGFPVQREVQLPPPDFVLKHILKCPQTIHLVRHSIPRYMCAYHVKDTFKADKVYIIVSASISRTENFTKLEEALGDRVVGVKKGIKSHTPWTDVLDAVREVRENGADLVVTLGAGSLTDGAKVVAYVCLYLIPSANHINTNIMTGTCKQRLLT